MSLTRFFSAHGLLFLAIPLFHLGLVSASGSTSTVTTALDEDDGSANAMSGTGTSIREAVKYARTGDTVVFDASLAGQTFALTNGQMVIATDLTVDGTSLADRPILSGSNTSRVFHVDSGASVTLDSVVLSDGFVPETPPDVLERSGGAIRNYGQLVVRDCDFRDNKFSALGGAILNVGTAIVSRTTFSNNVAMVGGGIANLGKLDVAESTFWQNTAGAFGGGIAATCPDESCTETSNTTVVNCTFTENYSGESGGGIYAGAGSRIAVIQSTIFGNQCDYGWADGGGISNLDGWLYLANSIIASNRNYLGPSDVSWTIDSMDGFNVLSTTNRLRVGEVGDPEHYFIGDVLLAPLGDYGGGVPTMPPLPGSSVIDAGLMTAMTPTNDQRGAVRPLGSRPDIGAVEAFDFMSAGLEDNDFDGIPDLIEPAYGHTVGVDDSQADSDGDGATDAEEIAQMTNPLDPGSRFAWTSITGTNGVPSELSFTSFPGFLYRVETSSNIDFSDPEVSLPIEATNHCCTIRTERFSPDWRFVRVRRD